MIAGGKGRGPASGAAALCLVAGLLAPVPAFSEKAPDLDELRDAILETRDRVGRKEREERALLEQLEESDRLLAALTSEVRTAREEAEAARERAAHFELRSRLARERLETTRTAMSRRVVALYKAGEVGPVRFLFASATMPELLTRASALQTFVAYDASLVARYREYLTAYEGLEQEAKLAAIVRDEAASRLGKRSEQMAQERRERRRILASVRADRTSERALLVELEKAARALEETVRALGDAATDGPELSGLDFAARKGRLAAPLDAEIALGFGKVIDEEFQTETFRKGVEFAAAGGESVRAVAPGAVRFAGWFRGYGKLVIVDHGDEYFSVVSHLNEVFVDVGDPVSEGDMLGSVGDTGSLTGPSLYFEIRRGGDPQDPKEWLAPRHVIASP